MANFNNIKALTLEKEGGLSRATTDTASKYPSPYVHNGQTGWHTNKGVTYKTFEYASKVLNFENNADNFINMPDAIWTKIAKNLYWDNLKLDTLKSDAIAFQLFSWNWGGGTGWFNRIDRYLTSKGIDWNGKSSTLAQAFNQLIDKQGEKKTVDELEQQQIEYYTSISQPANIKGWINRIKDTTKYAYTFVGKVVSGNKKTISYGLIGVVLIAVTYFGYKYYQKNK
jgi:hypothetical protein